MMGAVKNIPEHINQFDDGQIYDIIPISERVFIQSTYSRQRLIEYSQRGLNIIIIDFIHSILKSSSIIMYLVTAMMAKNNS